MTIVGTRPEIIRLSRVIHELDRYCDHCLVHTGQNFDYELNQVFFDDLEIRKPDFFLDTASQSISCAQTIGNVISYVDQLLISQSPDAFLILGDTNSCLAAISAKRRKIPIFHMEAGNRSFDMRVPEEINRRIVDHISDINLPYSSIARDFLIREGLPPDQVIKTGSPMREVISYFSPKIHASNILTRLNLDVFKYFIVSAHREENIENTNSFNKLVEVLNTLADVYDMPVLVSTHPRTRQRVVRDNPSFHSHIRLLKPFGFHDFLKLEINSKAVLSDSGTISEESSLLNFPALNLRESHERPEAIEEASVMLVGLEIDRILQALNILDSQPRGDDRLLRIADDYKSFNISNKVVRIIHSYVDYVNRSVWKKYS